MVPSRARGVNGPRSRDAGDPCPCAPEDVDEDRGRARAGPVGPGSGSGLVAGGGAVQGVVRLAIVGAGIRGAGYARLVAATGRARVVAVAEPRADRRERLARDHGIAPDMAFADWRELADRPRLADAVIVATQDALHVAPAVALTGRGYHMLLEKPMAPTEAGAAEIMAAVEAAGTMLAVCPVMRYSPYTRALKALLDAGRVGEVVGVQHLEPIGWWHFAHSYVRGNWRRADESSPMLLAKCCHDIDWLAHVIGRPV